MRQRRTLLFLALLTSYPLHPRPRAPSPLQTVRTFRDIRSFNLAQLALTTDALLTAASVHNALSFLGFRIPSHLNYLITSLLSYKASLLPDRHSRFSSSKLLTITPEALPIAKSLLECTLDANIKAVELDFSHVQALPAYASAMKDAIAAREVYKASSVVADSREGRYLSECDVAEMHSALGVLGEIAEIADERQILILLRAHDEWGIECAAVYFARVYPEVRFAISGSDGCGRRVRTDGDVKVYSTCMTGRFEGGREEEESQMLWGVRGVGDLQAGRLQDVGCSIAERIVKGVGSERIVANWVAGDCAREALRVEVWALWAEIWQRCRWWSNTKFR